MCLAFRGWRATPAGSGSPAGSDGRARNRPGDRVRSTCPCSHVLRGSRPAGGDASPEACDDVAVRTVFAALAALVGACARGPEEPTDPAAPAVVDVGARELTGPAPAGSGAAEARTTGAVANQAEVVPTPAGPPEPPRACAADERLDSGCACRDGGACGELCCAAEARCSRGRCVPTRACTDGESLASGCRCGGDRCHDLCCVGSACSHRGGEDGGWSKCVTLPGRRR